MLSPTLPQTYRLTNTLSSLYSALPKTFRCPPGSHRPQLDRMALVVVSSRECDSVYGDPYKISTLYGEIVGIERTGQNTVGVHRITTFSGNYDSAALHTAPTILFDEVHKLYQAGYRHVIYVARAPYTSTLGLTRGEPSDALYFMSRAIIGALKAGKPDLRIYPVFCAEYYAVKVRGLQVDSLYMQDVQERGALLQDENRRVVTFLELFNGRTIFNAAERVYNGVISYATMLNMHEGILDNNDTILGLLAEGPLRDDIIFYLTLFHFARYEAHGRNIVLKLDPYEGIIGDQSVGALARRPHLAPGLSFNFLAFLSDVRKVIAAGAPTARRRVS